MSAPELDLELLHEGHDPAAEANVAKDLISGTVGGIAQVLSGQPFDTTKVRLQSAPNGKYSGAMDVVRQLLREDGVKGFYRGTVMPLIGVGACVSAQFTVNEGMKRFFSSQNKSKGADQYLLAYHQLYISGGAAGFANSFLAAPIEQIRIRLQTQADGALKGPFDTIAKIWRAGGLTRGVFHGLGPTLLRETHGMGMYFLGAEACVKQDMAINGIARVDIPSWRMCMYGGVAGVVMWLTAYPLDVVKSRMQTDAMNPTQRRFKTMRACFADLLATGGPKALFRGFTPTLLRAAPVNACTFLGFEITRRAL